MTSLIIALIIAVPIVPILWKFLLYMRARRALKDAPRRYFLGFEPTLVRAGEEVTIEARPQIPFAVERLLVPSSIGGSFQILDILINGESVNSIALSELGLPAALFSENSMHLSPGNNLVETFRPNELIGIRVKNVSERDAEFCASMIGRSNATEDL